MAGLHHRTSGRFQVPADARLVLLDRQD